MFARSITKDEFEYYKLKEYYDEYPSLIGTKILKISENSYVGNYPEFFLGVVKFFYHTYIMRRIGNKIITIDYYRKFDTGSGLCWMPINYLKDSDKFLLIE